MEAIPSLSATLTGLNPNESDHPSLLHPCCIVLSFNHLMD